ncbi:hypothetical protein N866_04050 [Actinotalea ferrariae CF5-4]|uniref:DUF881 domain-containing protein n=1 Tax=Actinotalea ferrariae CF5-4 TaxID=948458 RepID=A0A021VSE8_9CELL|nr:DUF881 domain-containing protein [Actinotalea ferrariae]EYR62960.1 hypothetical protein N866_04050 [Actinotalea ferrariae CF5-4]
MPEHRDHAAHRAPRWPSLRGAVGVALVLALAGYLFAANAQLARVGNGREVQDLPGLVEAERERNETLAGEARALQAEIDRLTDLVADGAPESDPMADLVRLAAGRVPVTGPGVTVSLTDAISSGPRPAGVTNNDLVVHQQDLQAVINALWSGGAEAMGLQDQRVISTSAFLCVGNVLLLHDNVYSPPYTVTAIGDPDELIEALYDSEAIQRYLDYVEAYGLGWEITVTDSADLPAYEGAIELEYAAVPGADEADEAVAG